MKIKTLVLSVMIVLLLMFLYAPDCDAGGEIGNGKYLSDGKGSLYYVFHEGGNTKIWKYCEENPKSISTSSENFDAVFVGDQHLYLIKNQGRLLYIMADSKPVMTEVNLGDRFQMAVSGEDWYFAEESEPCQVIKCDNRGKFMKKMEFPFDIKMLVSDTESQKVFAVTENGVIDAESKQRIECAVPVMPLKVNGNIYTDSVGDCYLFDSRSGFQKILDTEYEHICGTKNAVYALYGDEIYELDGTGEPQAVCHMDFTVSDVTASGNAIYAMTETEAVYIPENKFEKIVKEPSTVSEIFKAEFSQREESRKESTVSEPPKKQDDTISSDVYEMVSNKMYLPEGTTVAQFKKNVYYGDNSVSFVNHNGKTVTSGEMGTGWQVNFNEKSYDIIVRGDITGEGNVNTRDMYLLRDYLLGKTELSPCQQEAADRKSNHKIDIADLYVLTCELHDRGIV